MNALNPIISKAPPLSHAAELIQLVDLEAGWENLRGEPSQGAESFSLEVLLGKQKAYDAYRNRLVAYNQRHTPVHLPEALLSTPARLERWCRKMGELCGLIEGDPQASCPTHVIEKAYRQADSIARKLGKQGCHREAAPATVRAAITALADIGSWCRGLAGPDRSE